MLGRRRNVRAHARNILRALFRSSRSYLQPPFQFLWVLLEWCCFEAYCAVQLHFASSPTCLFSNSAGIHRNCICHLQQSLAHSYCYFLGPALPDYWVRCPNILFFRICSYAIQESRGLIALAAISPLMDTLLAVHRRTYTKHKNAQNKHLKYLQLVFSWHNSARCDCIFFCLCYLYLKLAPQPIINYFKLAHLFIYLFVCALIYLLNRSLFDQ